MDYINSFNHEKLFTETTNDQNENIKQYLIKFSIL